MPENFSEYYQLPTESPTSIPLNNNNKIIQSFIQQIVKQNEQPHTEKLILQPLPTNSSLPIGLAFFDALKSENNPYFRSIILEKPKKKIVEKQPSVQTATEFTIVVKDKTERVENEFAPKSEDYPEFGEKINPTLPNLLENLQNVDEHYYDYYIVTDPPKPKKRKSQNLKKKSKSKNGKPKSKKKYYYDKNTYYPAESQRISTRVGMMNSRFVDTMKQVIPKTGLINHSGYSTVRTYTLPQSVAVSSPTHQSRETQSTASATNHKAEVNPSRSVKKPPPPPPKELHYFQ